MVVFIDTAQCRVAMFLVASVCLSVYLSLLIRLKVLNCLEQNDLQYRVHTHLKQ